MDNSLIHLIDSLSQAEKRQFKLAAKKQGIDNAYVHLFDILCRGEREAASIKKSFHLKFPKASIESAAVYLQKLIVDTLIANKINKDDHYKMLYGLLQIKLLKERGLPANAYMETVKNMQRAKQCHDLPLLYKFKREQLNYLSKNDFDGITEKSLIEKQQETKDLLRDMRNTQEHYSLYELLKYRLNKTSHLLTEHTKAQMNDLVLSEIAIINSNAKQTLESKRLHLLFQSFYFVKTGDYRSALRTFSILNEQYEKKFYPLQQPPLDYYAILEGILNSLQMINHYEEMEHYLKNLEALDREEHPTYFNQLVRNKIHLTRLWIAAHEERWQDAQNLLLPEKLIKKGAMGLEIDFYYSLVYYKLKQLNKAIRQINKIILQKNVDNSSVVYRAARLLNVVMYFENRDYEYLDYEIRSYKRIFKGKIKPLLSEKFVFKIVQANPGQKSNYARELLWKKMLPIRDLIINNRYEAQILKFFDFVAWGEHQFFLPAKPKVI